MTETKTSKPGVDWTKLLTDPDIISHLAELLQAYRDAEPARRDQVLRETMRNIKSEAAKAQPSLQTSREGLTAKTPAATHLLNRTFSLLAGVRIGDAIRE